VSIESHAYLGGLLVTSTMNEPRLGVDTVKLELTGTAHAVVGVDGDITVVLQDGSVAGEDFHVRENPDRSWSVVGNGLRLVTRTDSRLTAVGALLASF
jgi:hypothetical protein